MNLYFKNVDMGPSYDSKHTEHSLTQYIITNII